MSRKSERARLRARFELVLSGHSEFGFGDRALAEAERLAWELVNRYGDVVHIDDWRVQRLRNPYGRRRSK